MGSGGGRSLVVQGDPGTGKTIVAIYLMKLLIDIQKSGPDEAMDQDTLFAEFFSPEFRALLTDFRVGLVIPQQSLRKTVQAVFSKTPGLHKSMVMNPFDVGESELPFDLLIVDEAHRLGQRSNQPSAALNSKFSAINKALFGEDRDDITQLDWIKAQSRHQLYLIDSAQSIKPADLPSEILNKVISTAQYQETFFHLASQMRVNGGHDYVNYIGDLVKAKAPVAPRFGDYEFRFFDDSFILRAY
jgi:hypothetical protein